MTTARHGGSFPKPKLRSYTAPEDKPDRENPALVRWVRAHPVLGANLKKCAARAIALDHDDKRCQQPDGTPRACEPGRHSRRAAAGSLRSNLCGLTPLDSYGRGEASTRIATVCFCAVHAVPRYIAMLSHPPVATETEYDHTVWSPRYYGERIRQVLTVMGSDLLDTPA